MFEIRGFESRPLIVFWELTRACPLACVHCRSSAVLEPLPGELGTGEALGLVEDISGFGKPHPLVVLTGGDPLMRKDLLDIAGRLSDLGIPFAVAPAVSKKIFSGIFEKLVGRGLRAVSISIDSPFPEHHDRIRGLSGSFDMSLRAFRYLSDLGVRVQINTVAMRSNVESFPRMAGLVRDLGASAWEVFYLVTVGRGSLLDSEDLSPGEAEDLAHFLYDVSKHGILVRTVEAPFFRRVAIARRGAEKDPRIMARFPKPGRLYESLSRELGKVLGDGGEQRLQVHPTRDGHGIVFISHDGEVYPGGLAPYRVGSVRESSIVKIYRDNPVLRSIRRARFKGKCGVCEFRYICGGSRARALARYRDILGPDPACPYTPRGA